MNSKSNAELHPLIADAMDCTSWPEWLADMVKTVTDYDDNMSTEQAVALGILLSASPSRLEAISEAEPVACEYCGGEGRNSDGHCANCHGSGWVWAEPRHTPPAGHVVVPGADEAFDALDLADALIERGYGTQVPKEWTRAYRRVAKARAALPHNQGGAK